MAIDGGDHRPRMEENRLIEKMKRGQELADVVGAATAQLFQVDARAEYLALARENNCLFAGLAQLSKARGQRIAKFDVERIGFAVGQRQHSNSINSIAFDHAPCSAGVDRDN